jgi:lipopolysaccharide transport system ATP-binding protein
MPNIAISVENLSKSYRLGQIGTGTFSNDLKLWWAKLRGKPNPLLRIGEQDYGNRDGEELWALRDVSFTVQQGEALGIIGRNGAGKSTLLKILSRVTAPTSGKIKVKGRVASLLEVGTGFHPELTGRENIYLNGAILGMSKDEVTRKFDEIVDFAEIEKFITTPVKRYSSGMYVRLAFAVAAHLDPEILVVDEVLAVGDAEFQKKCLGKMGEVAKDGRTVLFVSHNMGAIAQFCRKTLLIHRGELVQIGETSAVVQEYMTSGHDVNMQIELEPNRKMESAYVLVRALVIKSNGSSNGNVSVTEGFSITLDILARRIVAGTDLTIRINNQVGVPIFSASVSQKINLSKAFKIGKNRFSLHIPSHFLSPGIYTVSLGIHQPFIELFDKLDDFLTFEISETGSNRWAFKGRNYGVVLVDFPWTIESG